MLLGIKLVFII